MNYEKFGAAVTMSLEELKDVVESHMEDIDMERITDMMANIAERETEEESQAMREATPIIKISYMCRETYRLGFMYGLYMYNEVLKEEFKDMQARKVERVNKKKAGNRIAEA